MVIPGGKIKSRAIPFTDIPPQIMALGWCFMVCIVYSSSNVFPVGLQTQRLRVVICCTVDSSVNNACCHWLNVHFACFLTNPIAYLSWTVLAWVCVQIYEISSQIHPSNAD